MCLALIACGGSREGAAPDDAPPQKRASIDELQQLAHTPRACEGQADCPGGSHCDADTDRCEWSCYADSDCGRDDQVCDLRGECVAAAAEPASGPRSSTISSQLAADHPTCQALPLAEKLEALAELETSPMACFEDLDCPCGAYCANDGTCRFDCMFDNPTAPPFCQPGQVCSVEGRCVQPSGTDDPSIIADLEVTPGFVQGNTAPALVVAPADVRIRAKHANHVATAVNVTARLEVVPRTGGPTSLMPRVRCAAIGAFASSCELGTGWQFGADPDPLRSSPRQIFVELPQTAVADEWTLLVRSEWADEPVSLSAFARPVIEPPHETGHFTGTLRWPQPGGDPLVLPIEADVTSTRFALYEPSRLLLPEGPAVLSKLSTSETSYPWLRSDHSTQSPREATAVLNVQSWSFEAAHERITSNVQLTLGNGPAPVTLSLELKYDRPSASTSCPMAGCGAGRYCNTELGQCMAGTRSWTTIRGAGFTWPSTELFSAQRAAWAPAVQGLRTAHGAQLGGDDVIGVERAMCFASPSQTSPGRLASSNANPGSSNPALETLCTAGGSDSAQQVFPYANRTTAVTVDSQGHETFNLLDTCLQELAIEPGTPYTAANLLQPRQCVSVARYMLAMSAPTSVTTNYPQTARRRLQHQLTRQWVSLHALIARGAVQENEYDEVVDNSSGQPAYARLGQAVDVLEKAWRLVVQAKRTDEGEVAAAQKLDYRTLGRPVAHWTFNQALDGVLPDTEGAHPISLASIPVAKRGLNYLSLANDAGATCRTESDVALSSRHFSVAAWMGVTNTLNTYILFQKLSATDNFQIRMYNWSGTTRRVEVSHRALINGSWSTTGYVTFDVPIAAGYYAFVVDGGKYRLQHLYRDANGTMLPMEYSPVTVSMGGPVWGLPGKVHLGCQVPQGTAVLDEISLWDRPLPVTTTQAFAQGYVTAANGNDPIRDSLPPRQLALSPDDEQAQGLAVHLVDGLAAHMELLSAYVRAERSELFLECGSATLGPARSRVLDRAGRALRLATVIENDARDLVGLAGATATSWLPRYTAAVRLLAGKRAEVVQQLGLATRCANPLGISDKDLPLYHGTEVGESARFFASSRFLAAEAREQVDDATDELEQARGAWQQQRLSIFQSDVLGQTEKAERLRKIEQEYEGALRRLCGVPVTGTVFAAFKNNTMTSTNCFLKLEVPGCSGAEAMSLKAVPAQCLRGEIGEQILQIQAAELDSRNAENAYDRSIDQYNAEMVYCTRREDHHEETLAIQTAHRAHMIKLRAARRSAGMMGGMVKSMVGMTVGALAGQPQMALGSWLDAVGMIAGQAEVDAAEDEQDAETAHQLVMAARNQALDLMACFHGADNQKFAIDAASDVITRANHDTKSALLRLENQQAELRTLVAQGQGDLDFEGKMVRVLPHHHYWLDDHIDAYRRHFAYAQRLTYLALRAFEYESQQSLGMGNAVLAARTPAVLDAAVLVLEQRTAPMQGEQGYVVGEFDPVMSLRDEILRLGTADAPPGFPPLSSIESLRAYLASDAAKIYSNGQYVGRGVRFALRPQPWAQFSCAERIWRITTALQVEGSPPNNAQLLLWQENSFASQRCRAAEHGELHVARIQPEKNLLVGETGNFEGSPFVQQLRYTAMLTSALGNRSRAQLEEMPEGLHSGFAGRGLYANYVLLFPSAMFDNAAFLATVKDVLIRFDLVQVTNISGDPDE